MVMTIPSHILRRSVRKEVSIEIDFEKFTTIELKKFAKMTLTGIINGNTAQAHLALDIRKRYDLPIAGKYMHDGYYFAWERFNDLSHETEQGRRNLHVLECIEGFLAVAKVVEASKDGWQVKRIEGMLEAARDLQCDSKDNRPEAAKYKRQQWHWIYNLDRIIWRGLLEHDLGAPPELHQFVNDVLSGKIKTYTLTYK